MVPGEVTRAVLAEELKAVEVWCKRQGWAYSYDAQRVHLAYEMTHPKAKVAMKLVAGCDGYRALPPKWLFVDPGNGQPTRRAFPEPGQVPGVAGSIFHGNAVICAPWNLLAYQHEGGPHQDWGNGASWHIDRPPYTRATNLAEMLATIAIHLRYSPGMQE